jgi:hypothetical protein
VDRSSVPLTATGHSLVAWCALVFASLAVVLVAVAVSGNGLGGAGALLSAAAFVLAVVARAKKERWALLWLPLLLFPALLVSAPFWV